MTDFGNDSEKVQTFATEKFGFRFMIPGDEVESIMQEDASNFQEFYLKPLDENDLGVHGKTRYELYFQNHLFLI